jgi:hypothetical protein
MLAAAAFPAWNVPCSARVRGRGTRRGVFIVRNVGVPSLRRIASLAGWALAGRALVACDSVPPVPDRVAADGGTML